MKNLKKEIEEEFGEEWQDNQREEMVRIQFPTTIKRIKERVRLEERKKTLEEVEDGLIQIELNQMPSNTLYTDKDIMVSVYEVRKILSKITKRGK